MVKGPVSFSVLSLPAQTLVAQGSLQTFLPQRLDLGDTSNFKLTTSAPVFASLGSDGALAGATYFFPQADGRRFWGTEFFLYLESDSTFISVFARDPAQVEILDATGNVVASNASVGAGLVWFPKNLSKGNSDHVRAKAPSSNQAPNR